MVVSPSQHVLLSQQPASLERLSYGNSAIVQHAHDSYFSNRIRTSSFSVAAAGKGKALSSSSYYTSGTRLEEECGDGGIGTTPCRVCRSWHCCGRLGDSPFTPSHHPVCLNHRWMFCFCSVLSIWDGTKTKCFAEVSVGCRYMLNGYKNDLMFVFIAFLSNTI